MSSVTLTHPSSLNTAMQEIVTVTSAEEASKYEF